jgi:ATP-dependent DNA ligase
VIPVLGLWRVARAQRCAPARTAAWRPLSSACEAAPERVQEAIPGTLTLRTFRPVQVPVGFIEPCIPTAAANVPEGPMWLHEIKHDGYRLMVRRTADRVRL